jgi:hypothetical protein
MIEHGGDLEQTNFADAQRALLVDETWGLANAGLSGLACCRTVVSLVAAIDPESINAALAR